MRNQVSLRHRQASRFAVLKIGAVVLLTFFAALLGTASVQGVKNGDPIQTMAIVPFLAAGGLIFREPDQGGGGGGGGENKAPEPVGDTVEAKLTSAKGFITSLFADVSRLTGELAQKVADFTGLQSQFDALKTTAQAEKDAHVATKGELTTEKAAHTATTGKLTPAESRISNLEALCNLKGIDPNQVIPPAPATKSGDDERAELVKNLNAAKTPAERGEAANALRDFDAKAKRAAAKAKE